MRWLADECVDAALVAWPRSDGHNVVYMAESGAAASDVEVMDRAQQDDRLLLTEDKDFGELVFRRSRPVPGVVLLRVDPAMRSLKQERLAAAIARFGDALLGRYMIIEEARFRSRPLHRDRE